MKKILFALIICLLFSLHENQVDAETSLSISLQDASGSITSGGTAQTALAADTSRKFICFQNVSSGDLWINFGVIATADSPSFKYTAGNGYCWDGVVVPTDYISIIGATTGQKFTLKYR